MTKKTLIPIIGMTGSGKSTLFNAVRVAIIDGKLPDIGLIEVGQEMRRRHPPERFNGKAAMDDTEAEVWEIFDTQMNASTSDFVMCDGQPRTPGQVHQISARFRNIYPIWLHTHVDILTQRANLRSKDTPTLQMHIQRITNDRVQLFDTVHEMMSNGMVPDAVDTGRSWWIEDVIKTIRRIVSP